MYHKIIDAFSTRVSYERLVIYKEAVSLLLLMDLSVYDLMFDNFYDSVFESDTITNVADFDNLLVGNLRGGVESFGVYINMDMVDGKSVAPLTALLSMLYQYADYESHDELIRMLDIDLPANELVAELVATMTQYTQQEEIMVLIEEVSASTINRMRTISEDILMTLDDDTPTSDPYQEQYRYFSRVSARFSNSSALTLLNTGWAFGRAFDVYADALVPIDTPMSPKEIAENLCLAAIMAGKKESEVIDTVGRYIQLRYDNDLTSLMAIGRSLNHLDLSPV